MHEYLSSQEQKGLDFQNLNLWSIKWTQSNRVEADDKSSLGRIENRCWMPIVRNGEAFELYAEHIIWDKNAQNKKIQDITFRIQSPDTRAGSIHYIHGHILFEQEGKEIEAEMAVHKETDHENLVGAGLELWQKMLKYIEDTARKEHTPITHTVMMDVTISTREKKLTRERRLEIFGPTLKQKGYIQTSPKRWMKEYIPLPKIKRAQPSAGQKAA